MFTTTRALPPYTLRHLDLKGSDTSIALVDLLWSYVHPYAHLQDGSEASLLACDAILHRAATDVLYHFTFPEHDALKVATVALALPLRKAIRRWLTARLPAFEATAHLPARRAGPHWKPGTTDNPHHPKCAIETRIEYGQVPAFIPALRSTRNVADMSPPKSSTPLNTPHGHTQNLPTHTKPRLSSGLSSTTASHSRLPPRVALNSLLASGTSHSSGSILPGTSRADSKPPSTRCSITPSDPRLRFSHGVSKSMLPSNASYSSGSVSAGTVRTERRLPPLRSSTAYSDRGVPSAPSLTSSTSLPSESISTSAHSVEPNLSSVRSLTTPLDPHLHSAHGASEYLLSSSREKVPYNLEDLWLMGRGLPPRQHTTSAETTLAIELEHDRRPRTRTSSQGRPSVALTFNLPLTLELPASSSATAQPTGGPIKSYEKDVTSAKTTYHGHVSTPPTLGDVVAACGHPQAEIMLDESASVSTSNPQISVNSSPIRDARDDEVTSPLPLPRHDNDETNVPGQHVCTDDSGSGDARPGSSRNKWKGYALEEAGEPPMTLVNIIHVKPARRTRKGTFFG